MTLNALNRLVWTTAIPLLFVTSTLQAQTRTGPQGLGVVGVGELKVRPDRMVIRVIIEGAAELADDAFTKFHQTRTRFLEKMTKEKPENLKVRGTVPSVSYGQPFDVNAWNMGMGESTPDPEFRVTEMMEVWVSGLADLPPTDAIEKNIKVLSMIKESGHQPQSTTQMQQMQMAMGWYQSGISTEPSILRPVEYHLKDKDAARREANALAYKDALRQAKELAGLMDVELGAPLSMQMQPGPMSWEAGLGTVTLKVQCNARWSIK